MDITSIINLVSEAKNNKKDSYILSFTKETNGNWYYDYKNWPGLHHNLMMVKGSDILLDCFNNGSNKVKLFVSRTPKEDCIHLKQVKASLLGGSTYNVVKNKKLPEQIWICPVTLCVLGDYPKDLYIKLIN